MSEKGNGNVRGEGGPERPQQQAPPAPLKPGDIVALTSAALRIGRLAPMTPRQLYQLGHENRFLVLEVFETDDEGPCVMLSPCCFSYIDRRSGGGKPRCKGHPSVYFEKVGVFRMPRKGDKSSSIALPLIGELLRFDWQEDEDNPGFNMNIGGLRASSTGFFAKLLKKLADEKVI